MTRERLHDQVCEQCSHLIRDLAYQSCTQSKDGKVSQETLRVIREIASNDIEFHRQRRMDSDIQHLSQNDK